MYRHLRLYIEPIRRCGALVLRFAGYTAPLLLLSGCTEGVLATHGPIAAEERQLLLEALVCMLIVVVPVLALTLYFAWWYRASNRAATYRPDWSYSGRIEFSIWAIPLLVILFLACLAWSGSHELDPYKAIKSDKAPLQVDVVSLDWKWVFIYPTLKIATVNELAIPVGQPVEFHLTSGTVMNSFFIPGLAGQIYTMAGMQTRLSVLSKDAGIYRGMSSQFSGDGFSDMHFQVLAMDAPAFDAWTKKVRSQSATVMNYSEFDALAAVHKTQAVAYYANVEGDVFDHALRFHDSHRTMSSTTGMSMSSSPSHAGP